MVFLGIRDSFISAKAKNHIIAGQALTSQQYKSRPPENRQESFVGKYRKPLKLGSKAIYTYILIAAYAPGLLR